MPVASPSSVCSNYLHGHPLQTYSFIYMDIHFKSSVILEHLILFIHTAYWNMELPMPRARNAQIAVVGRQAVCEIRRLVCEIREALHGLPSCAFFSSQFWFQMISSFAGVGLPFADEYLMPTS